MSQFLNDAGAAIDKRLKQMGDYAHVYAFSRGSGLSPFEASGAAHEWERGLPHTVLQYLRDQIEAIVAERAA